MRRSGAENGDAAEMFLASVEGTRLEVAWQLVALGLRVGEVLALRWADVDAATGRITVMRPVPGVPYSALAAPAFAPRERVVDGAAVLGLLDRHQRRQQAARSEWGSEYDDEGLVVCSENGRPLHPHDLHRAFSQAAIGAGLPVLRLSQLRDGRPTTRARGQVWP